VCEGGFSASRRGFGGGAPARARDRSGNPAENCRRQFLRNWSG
jgi:hypothetical protein